MTRGRAGVDAALLLLVERDEGAQNWEGSRLPRGLMSLLGMQNDLAEEVSRCEVP